MKDKKPYVGAAMFYDRFGDDEGIEIASTFLAADGAVQQGAPGRRSEVDDRQAGNGSLASRMLRAVLALRSTRKTLK